MKNILSDWGDIDQDLSGFFVAYINLKPSYKMRTQGSADTEPRVLIN